MKLLSKNEKKNMEERETWLCRARLDKKWRVSMKETSRKWEKMEATFSKEKGWDRNVIKKISETVS